MSVIVSGTAHICGSDAQELNAREQRILQRSIQKRKQDKNDEEKKAKKTKAAADKVGPSENTKNVRTKEEEEALAQMMNITGRSKEECAQALIIQTEPGKKFTEVYHSAIHMLMDDDDPNKKSWADLAKGFRA